MQLAKAVAFTECVQMPNRVPKKSKKPTTSTKPGARAAELEEQRRRELAVRSTLARYQNRTSDRK